MTDIVRVTEEEFDAEGNLTRRVITEYGVAPLKFAKGGVFPNPNTHIVTYAKGEEPYTVNQTAPYVGPYGVGTAFGE